MAHHEGRGRAMQPILRSVAAVIAGFAVASVVMMAVETVNGKVLYPELGTMAEDVTDREALREVVASAPVGSLLVVILGWLLGSTAGGYVAARIGASAPERHALALGVLLTLAGILNNLLVPPPPWMWVISLLLFVPAAWLGARLAQRSVPAR